MNAYLVRVIRLSQRYSTWSTLGRNARRDARSEKKERIKSVTRMTFLESDWLREILLHRRGYKILKNHLLTCKNGDLKFKTE